MKLSRETPHQRKIITITQNNALSPNPDDIYIFSKFLYYSHP